MAPDKKPGKNAPRAKIVEWLRKHWRADMWGLMDCDRCPARAHAHPCDACGTWDVLVQKHRGA